MGEAIYKQRGWWVHPKGGKLEVRKGEEGEWRVRKGKVDEERKGYNI